MAARRGAVLAASGAVVLGFGALLSACSTGIDSPGVAPPATEGHDGDWSPAAPSASAAIAASLSAAVASYAGTPAAVPSPQTGKLTVTPTRGVPGTAVELVATCPAVSTVTVGISPFSLPKSMRTDAKGQLVVKTSVPKTQAAGPLPVELICSPDAGTGKSLQLIITDNAWVVLG